MRTSKSPIRLREIEEEKLRIKEVCVFCKSDSNERVYCSKECRSVAEYVKFSKGEIIPGGEAPLWAKTIINKINKTRKYGNV